MTDSLPHDIKPKRIFISYGHDEMSPLAGHLKKDLIARGHEVWFDEDRIKPGGDWEQYIEEGLEWASGKNNGCVLLLMTPHSVRRPDGFCLNELARAIQRTMRIIPVMLVWCEPPLSICRIQWLDMQDCVPLDERYDRYRVKFTMLAEALEHDKLDFEGFQTFLFNLLKPLSFDAEIKYNMDMFTGRRWVFEEIDRWLASRSTRIFWIAGSPGVGKSAISAWLCAHRREIVAFHFCRFDNVQKRDPRRCIMSIAYQLSTQLPEYEERLKSLKVGDISDMDAKTLFDHLIVQPLSGILEPGREMVILIDALDEATVNGKNELSGFIASEFERTPEWLRLIVTSRPDPDIMGTLQAYTPFVVNISDPRNESDISLYLAREIKKYNGQKDVPPADIDVIVKKSEGLFLYAEWIVKELSMGRLSIDKIDEFPQGLGGIYLKFFERQSPDVSAWESGIRPALEVLSALQEPIDMKALSSIFHWSVHEERKFKRSMGSLFQFDGPIRPFHKSLMEWLTNEDKHDPYFVSVPEGHKMLAGRGYDEYRSGSWSSYLTMYLPTHLCVAGRFDELKEVLGNLRFIRNAWEKDRYNLMKQWTFIEEYSAIRMDEVYGAIVEFPEKADDKDILAIAYLLKSTFHFNQSLRLLRFLKDTYERNGDKHYLQEVLGSLAWILIEKSDFSEAMALLTEEERICRETGNMDGLQYSLLHQATILAFMNDFESAMALIKEQEGICRKMGNMGGIQDSLSLQSLILRVRGDFGRAMVLLKEQEKICREAGKLDSLLSSLMDQALILRLIGRLDESIKIFREQEAISRKIGNKDSLEGSLYGLSMVLCWKGELDQAMALVNESESICRETGNRFGLGEILGEKALILRLTGDLDGALSLLKERERISQDLADRWGLQFSYGNQAIILRMRGDLDSAMRLHQEEERICREIGHKRDLAMSLSNQAIIRRMKGDPDGALALHKEAERSLREIGYKYGLQEALGEQATTLYEHGDADGARALLKEQASICAEMGLKNDQIKSNQRLLQLHDTSAHVKEKESVL